MCKLSVQTKLSKLPIPADGCKFTRHDVIVQMLNPVKRAGFVSINEPRFRL